MPKRKTRKQKENTKYSFSVSWSPTENPAQSENSVKGQFKTEKKISASKISLRKDANSTAKESHLTEIKRNIVKSLIVTGFILSLEIVLYLL